jgi:hypothetical protein
MQLFEPEARPVEQAGHDAAALGPQIDSQVAAFSHT